METVKSGEVSYDAAKHARVREGGIVGTKEGKVAAITYEQPKDALFDAAELAKLSKAEHAQMAEEALGRHGSGSKA